MQLCLFVAFKSCVCLLQCRSSSPPFFSVPPFVLPCSVLSCSVLLCPVLSCSCSFHVPVCGFHPTPPISSRLRHASVVFIRVSSRVRSLFSSIVPESVLVCVSCVSLSVPACLSLFLPLSLSLSSLLRCLPLLFLRRTVPRCSTQIAPHSYSVNPPFFPYNNNSPFSLLPFRCQWSMRAIDPVMLPEYILFACFKIPAQKK